MDTQITPQDNHDKKLMEFALWQKEELIDGQRSLVSIVLIVLIRRLLVY